MMKSIQEKLAGWERSVITDYELGVLVASHLVNQEPPSRLLLQQITDGLSLFGLISFDKDFKPGSVYHLFGRIKPKAIEIACAVDPFAYISHRSEEHTSELQSLMRISYAVFCLKKKKHDITKQT